jgi:hypothetical protein
VKSLEIYTNMFIHSRDLTLIRDPASPFPHLADTLVGTSITAGTIMAARKEMSVHPRMTWRKGDEGFCFRSETRVEVLYTIEGSVPCKYLDRKPDNE